MSITPWQTRWDTLGIPKDTAIQGEINDLRAALAERDAEIGSIKQAITDPENQPSQYGTVPMTALQAVHAELHRTYECIRSHARITFAAEEKVQAQRKVLEQALEALKAQPIETRVVWKDGIDLDVPVAHSKLCKAAITAIQEVLHANKPE